MINCNLEKNELYTNNSKAISLQEKSFFGERIDDKIKYSLVEGFYLLENKKIKIMYKNKFIDKEGVYKKFKNIDKKFVQKYAVYKDLRKKGYILKTGLKFGSDFRAYMKGKNPKNSHAKWLIFIEQENSKISWQEFCAKNRVANSTKKNLLLAILDDQEDVIYYEIDWIKP